MKQELEPANELASAVLEARNVSKTYRLGELDVLALKNINLTIRRGDFVAIAGTSGSGKTTLLNLLGALDTPTTGEIYIDGVRTSELTELQLAHFRAERIGFVFQTFNLLPVLTARENIEYPLILLKTPLRERKERVLAALALVGLEKFGEHLPSQLSGGQRQRVAIARAIVKRPAVVLADEPTANLDKQTARDVVDLMLNLNLHESVSFVFSSHDPMILARSSRVIYLSDGEEIAAPGGGSAL